MRRSFRLFLFAALSLLAFGLIGFGVPVIVGEIQSNSSGQSDAILLPMPVLRARTVVGGGDDLVLVKVRGVISPPGMDSPAVVLSTEDQDRLLPIFIGHTEAVAILRNLNQIDLPRPMTHDLLLAVMQHLGGKVNRVVVTRLDQGTYYADLEIGLPEGKTAVLDARPSDSIALAVKSGADIFVSRALLEEAGHAPGDPEEKEDAPAPPRPEPGQPGQPRYPI